MGQIMEISGFRFLHISWRFLCAGFYCMPLGSNTWQKLANPNFLLILLNFQDGERNESVVGALDMGGGSTEISFIPDSKTRIPDEYRDELVIYGNNYSLYTHSFLCYGMREAERRVLASLVQVNVIPISIRWHFNDSREYLSDGVSSIRYAGAYAWNDIPYSIKLSPTSIHFHPKLKSQLLPTKRN